MSERTGSDQTKVSEIPVATAFSIMFVTVGLCCFVWQTLTSGEMFYKSRKPIIGLVFFQALLGIVTTLVTLLTSIELISCDFRLFFSIVGVNIGDIILQFVLLWKAYLGNNHSKTILFVGMLPIIGITVFILINLTIGRSQTDPHLGICSTSYPVYIVVIKAAIDCASNAFLSACFILVIYKHYQVLGILGGDSPILYTIDWYLASYLIIKQLRQRDYKSRLEEEDDDDNDNDDLESSTENDSASIQIAGISNEIHVEKSIITSGFSQSLERTSDMSKKPPYRFKYQDNPCQCRQREAYYHSSLDNSTIAPSISTSRGSVSCFSEKDEHVAPTIPVLSSATFYRSNASVSLSPPPRDLTSFALKEEEKK
ncbi:hypothetical protein BD560DRAFT_368303 [Blakeslea trispora]|nr:hypothetical protein BD560DRAFT_368303 [Blakeslea trispora]